MKFDTVTKTDNGYDTASIFLLSSSYSEDTNEDRIQLVVTELCRIWYMSYLKHGNFDL